MKQGYVIAGYGIPKNILKDEHYNHYLKIVFNQIFDRSEGKDALIVFSGGMTDMFKPYRRSEAGEMNRLFEKLANRSVVREATKKWKYMLEKKSLSTLENLLYSYELLKKKTLHKNPTTVFCEYTREYKVKVLSKKVFGKSAQPKVYAIDFDVSLNRYDTELIKRKEREDIKFSLWALKSPDNFKRYKKIFKDRITYFRTLDLKKHPRVIQDWWRAKLKELTETDGCSNI